MSTSKPINTIIAATTSAFSNNASPFSNAGGAAYSYTTVGVSGMTIGMPGTVVFTNAMTVTNGANSIAESISRSPYNASEPAVGQTAISVYQVSALLENGNSVNVVRHEFPSLTREQINAAWDYTKRFPNPHANHPTEPLKDFVSNSDFYKLSEIRPK
jgi:uncharacterized protein (DUF433 family)